MENIIKLIKTKFSISDKRFKVIFFMLALTFSLLCAVTYSGDEIGTEKYPLSNSFLQQQQYKLQFAAFLDGHIALDAEPSELLSEIENPYDPDERDRADLHPYYREKENSYLWDIAYYDGQYFSYFGIAPIITVYYPYYVLTGSIPSHSSVCLILAFLSCVFLTLAYRESLLAFTEKANLIMTVVGGFALFFCSGILNAVACPDNYYLAVISSVCFSASSVFWGFYAARAKKTYARCIAFMLCAISLTLTVWSRPSSAIMCLLLVPTLVKCAAKAIGKIKTKEKNFLCELFPPCLFLIALFCGAVAVMSYNAVRFGSPFEFGARYQLTVNDISSNKLSASLISESLYAYFLQPPEAVTPFLLFEPSLRLFTSADRFIYCSETLGCIWFGLPLGIFTGFTKNNFLKNKIAFFTPATVLFTAICMAFVNFCIGGVNMRYLIDILPMLSLVGTASLIGAYERSEGKRRVGVMLVFAVSCVLAGLSGIGCAVFVQ